MSSFCQPLLFFGYFFLGGGGWFFYLLTWKLVIKNGNLSGLNKPYHGKLIMHYKDGVLAFIKLFECNPDALLLANNFLVLISYKHHQTKVASFEFIG